MRRLPFEIVPLVLAFTAALDPPPLAAQVDPAPELALASSVRGPARDNAVYIGWTPQADETVPMYAWSVDAMTRAAELMPLRESGALGGARREVRLWMGFGLGAPDWMLRVVDDPAGARGELRFWWSSEARRIGIFDGTAKDRAEWVGIHRRFTRQMRRDTERAGCTERTETASHETCRFTFAEEPDWGAILATIDSLDVWTLANPANLSPPLRGGMHGSTLVVEVRDGARYRTYAYWCPSIFPHVPEAVRADALAQLAEPMLARWRSIMSARFDEQQRRWYREHLRRERAKL